MAKERTALIVHYDPNARGADALAELNAHLADDWTVVTTTAMGGAAVGPGVVGPEVHFAALVVLEREEKRTVGGFHAE
jgi:hypothetical protein